MGSDFVRRAQRSAKRFYHDALNLYARTCLKRGREFLPLAIVPISGGLGNQIWHYMIGVGVEKYSGLSVKYDLSWYKNFGLDIQGKEKRDFELLRTFPGLSLPIARADEAAFLKKYYRYEPKDFCLFDENVYWGTRPRYLEGFCAHAKYLRLVEEEAKKLLMFSPEIILRNADTLRQIQDSGVAVAVHVRRGDYLGSIHDVLTPGYYRAAIETLTRRLAPKTPLFYVFSNDLAWCREFFREYENVAFPEGEGRSVADDFYLMTQCRHHIIANSTLSWSAAWLSMNADMQVVMPEIWYAAKARAHNRRGSETAFRVPGWIVLPVGG